MAVLNDAQLKAKIDQLWPDNSSGEISALDGRTIAIDIVDSTPSNAELNAKADLNSPTLIGSPKAPTPNSATAENTEIATVGFIPEWARVGSTTRIPASKIPSQTGLTDDDVSKIRSQIQDWAEAGNTDQIPDGKIPASIARDSEIIDWAKTGNTDQIPEAKISSDLVRDSGIQGFKTESEIRGYISNWAEEGNTDQIPSSKFSVTAATQAQIDARILDWAQTGNTDPIPDAKLAAGITRDSEIEEFAKVASTDTIADAKIPAEITRDTEVEEWAKTSTSTTIPLARIDASIPRSQPDITGFLTQAQVDARVAAGVADWAEDGNNSDIPDSKLSTAIARTADIPSITGFLTPAQVHGWAQVKVGNEELLPKTKLPATVVYSDAYPQIPAANISLDTSGFDRNLSTVDDTVQKAINRLDDLVASGGGGGTGGLTQAQVDSRVAAGVLDWAEAGNTDDIPVGKIPDLSAAKITSGTFADDRIPNFDATKITSGLLPVARIPELNASTINLDVTNFDNNLSNAVDDVQKLGQAVDDLNFVATVPTKFSSNRIAAAQTHVGMNLRSLAANGNDSSLILIDFSRGNAERYSLFGGVRQSTDFDRLSAAGNSDPIALWYTPDRETLYVADNTADKIFAYNGFTGLHESEKDINTLIAAGNRHPTDMVVIGNILFIWDGTDSKIYAYNFPSGTRNASRDFNTSDLVGSAGRGMFTDGTTLWINRRITENGGTGTYFEAYNPDTKARDASRRFRVSDDTSSQLSGPAWYSGDGSRFPFIKNAAYVYNSSEGIVQVFYLDNVIDGKIETLDVIGDIPSTRISLDRTSLTGIFSTSVFNLNEAISRLDSLTATRIPVDTSDFDGNLAAADNTIQKALQKFDDFTVNAQMGLTQNQVDARIIDRVSNWAIQGNATDVPDSKIPELAASKITSGEFATARIPNLSANKITTDQLNVDRIPNLNASKITAGQFGNSRISDLNASKINAGTLNQARVPNLPASRINSGAFADARIPNLNASKVTAGTFAPERLTRRLTAISQLGSATSYATGSEAVIEYGNPVTNVAKFRVVGTGSARRWLCISGSTSLLVNQAVQAASAFIYVSTGVNMNIFQNFARVYIGVDGDHDPVLVDANRLRNITTSNVGANSQSQSGAGPRRKRLAIRTFRSGDTRDVIFDIGRTSGNIILFSTSVIQTPSPEGFPFTIAGTA